MRGEDLHLPMTIGFHVKMGPEEKRKAQNCVCSDHCSWSLKNEAFRIGVYKRRD
jgi:hypothetical protein